MRLNLKDLAGFGIVTLALLALAMHAGDGHQRSHVRINAVHEDPSGADHVSTGGATLQFHPASTAVASPAGSR